MTRWHTKEGHRGDNTENIINAINELYNIKKLGLITKIPVPIKVLKRSKNKIIEAFFEKKSIVDYIGMVQGYGIAFDAKETNNAALPLKNIHSHQLEYMLNFRKQKGYAFIICNFKKYSKFYLIPIEVIKKYFDNALNGGRKSIPMTELDKRYEIPVINGLPYYLETLNIYIKDSENNYFENI